MTVTKDPEQYRLSRVQQMREGVLLLFGDRSTPEGWRLHDLSKRDWKRLLHWLDTSGLALYFYDRRESSAKSIYFPRPCAND